MGKPNSGQFKPGVRPAGAGRPKGTPNRRTLALQNQLEELGCDPVSALAEILEEQMKIARACLNRKKKNNDMALRALNDAERTSADVIQYLYPKKKAIEHSGEMNLFSFADFMALAKSGKKGE